MSAPAADIRTALRWCRGVTRRRARNFYYGLKLAPEPKRSALYAIYAWMRRADDLVDAAADEGTDEQLARVESFRRATEDALAGHHANDEPLWAALRWATSTFRLDPVELHAMLDGQIDDIRCRHYGTFEELREYCERVASSVGLTCIGIWGYNDPAARALAVDRGIAFQLTNILRDYKEDYDVGRVYLPESDFHRHGLTPEMVRHFSEPKRCRVFMEEQITRARLYYGRSAQLNGLIHDTCRPTLWAMTAIYRGLLDKMENEPSVIVGPRRVRLSSWSKGMIALRARMMRRSAAPTSEPERGRREAVAP